MNVPESPDRKFGGSSGQLPVSGDDLVKAALDQVEVQLPDTVECNNRLRFCIIKRHQRAAVEEDAIPFARKEERHRDPHVVLIQVLYGTSLVIDTGFILTKSVNGFRLFKTDRQNDFVRLSRRLRLKVTDEAPVTVHRFHRFHNRFFAARSPAHNGCIYKLQILKDKRQFTGRILKRGRLDQRIVNQ